VVVCSSCFYLALGGELGTHVFAMFSIFLLVTLCGWTLIRLMLRRILLYLDPDQEEKLWSSEVEIDDLAQGFAGKIIVETEFFMFEFHSVARLY